jgi:hypothetical protein
MTGVLTKIGKCHVKIKGETPCDDRGKDRSDATMG